jgi:hypothetical protein
MRPLVTGAFVAAFQFAMEEASERAISDAIRREIEPEPRAAGVNGNREDAV